MIHIYAPTLEQGLAFKRYQEAGIFSAQERKPDFRIYTNNSPVSSVRYGREDTIFRMEGVSDLLQEDIRRNGNSLPYPVQVVDIKQAT